MPRKAGVIAEDSAVPEPDPTIRRSTRIRVGNSPYSQVAPTTTVGRIRRNSTSSVDSVVSTNSTASLPVATKSVVRERRPSLSHESNLEKVVKASESTTPVKRNRRDSIGSLQEDIFVTVRAGSPAVATMSERRRTLRSASRSPTFEPSKDTTDSQISVTNETPSKIRGRRASAEKMAIKRPSSIALDVLDEEQEPVENPMELYEPKGKKLKTVNEEMEQEPKKTQLNIDENIEAKDTPKKKRLSSSENTIMQPNEDIRSRKSSESSSKSANLEKGWPSAIVKVSNVTVSQKLREQILANPKVVISLLSTKMPINNLNETNKLITEEDIQINEQMRDEIEIHTPGVESDDSEPTEHEKQYIKPDSLEKNAFSAAAAPPAELNLSSKVSPKHTNLISKSPIRKSPRLHSETRSNNPESPAGKVENYLISSMSSSPVISKAVSNIDSPKINTPSKECNIVNQASSLDESKEISDGCDGSFHLSVKSSIMSSQEESLNKSATDISDKENNQCALNISNEGDENTAYLKSSPVERISNVFRSKDIEESFFESMDVDYPSDNDESLTTKNVSIDKSVTQITQASDESSSGSLHLMCSDDNEEKANVSSNILKRSTIPDNRQSIALIELDKSIVPDDCNDPIVEPLKTTCLLDSRISILPCKLLTPLLTEIEQEKNTDLESPKSQETNSDNSPLENTCNQKKTCEADHNDIEANTFSVEVPEKELILRNSTEDKDGLTNEELVKSNKTPISPILNDTFTKRTPSSSSNTPTKPLETNEEEKTLSSRSDEECDKEQNSGIKFGDLPLVVDSQDSSDPEGCPNSDEKEVVAEAYDSYVEIVSDEIIDTNRVSDVDKSLKDKSENPAQFNRILELQSITIMSSNSSADQSSDSEDAKHTSNKIKEHGSITIKSSTSESDSDSKLHQLILDVTAESNEEAYSSDSDYKPNKFLDNEAMEGSDEDTPLEDSNEIIDIGENIEDTSDECKDEEVASQSDEDFIDDDSDVKMLSGNENDNDLDYDNKEVVAKKKKRRILTRPIDEVEETIAEETKTDVILNDSVDKSKKKRNSSISVSENIKKDDIDKTEISEKISDLVDLFCSRISDKKGGSVNVNMSLEYDESSSNDEESKKKSNLSTTSAINKSQKRKFIEQTAGACDSSTLADTKPSKIKVLQEVRISCDVEPQQQAAAQQVSSFKKSKKNKRHRTTRIKSYDDSVFLPDSCNNDNYTVMRNTPKPSTACKLPANVTSQLVDQKGIISKTNLKSEDYNEYYAPSTSRGGTTQWEIFDLVKQIKPSKHNHRKQSAENDVKELEMLKDFKNYMIAKNKPKVNKKSFKDNLKLQKKI